MAVNIIANDCNHDTDIEVYILRSIAVLSYSMHRQITEGDLTLPKAVLSAVKILKEQIFQTHHFDFEQSQTLSSF